MGRELGSLLVLGVAQKRELWSRLFGDCSSVFVVALACSSSRKAVVRRMYLEVCGLRLLCFAPAKAY